MLIGLPEFDFGLCETALPLGVVSGRVRTKNQAAQPGRQGRKPQISIIVDGSVRKWKNACRLQNADLKCLVQSEEIDDA